MGGANKNIVDSITSFIEAKEIISGWKVPLFFYGVYNAKRKVY